MNLRIVEPDGTIVNFTSGFTDRGDALYEFVVPKAQTDQEGTYGVMWFADASQFRSVEGTYEVIPRIGANFAMQYVNAGGGNFNLEGCFNFFQWKSKTILAAPLSDADLSTFEVAVTDAASAPILSITKGDPELVAGSGKAADRVFFAKVITLQTTGPWMVKITGTYAGVTFNVDFPMASFF